MNYTVDILHIICKCTRAEQNTHLRRKKSRTGHDLPISVKERVIWPICEDLNFTKLRICEVSLKLNSRENFRIYSIFNNNILLG